MESWKTRKRIVATALAAAGLMVFAAPHVRGEMLHVGIHIEMNGPGLDKAVTEIYAPSTAQPTTAARLHDQRPLDGLKRRWQTMREDLLRVTLETMTTMIVIYWGSPPRPRHKTITTDPPPTGQGSTHHPPPPPPPPSGSGDPPTTIDPPTDPPCGTPEPAGFVLAFLGAGLTSLYGWNKRWLARRASEQGKHDPSLARRAQDRVIGWADLAWDCKE